MPLPFFSPELLGSQLGGAALGGGLEGAATGAAGAAGAAAGGGMNLMMILPILFSFLQSSGLFGETQEQKEEARYKEMMGLVKPGFKYWGGQARGLNPAIMKALMGQMGRTANWGWPAGKGMDMSFLENLNIPGSFGGKVRV